MPRRLLPLAAVGAAVATCLSCLPATAAPQAAAADAPPTSHNRSFSVLPPGEDGFFTSDEQAQYEADKDPNDFGPHVDDQREMFWSSHRKSAGFATPQGTPVSPATGVRIYRDRFGVPLVYGDNDHDVWFGAGYAAAVDRLFEIDAIRRTARGTLAELTGPGSVPAD